MARPASVRAGHGRVFRGAGAPVYGYPRMKTLTELSGTLVRTAAAALAEARRSLPKEERAPEGAEAGTAPAAPDAAPPESAGAEAAPGATEGTEAAPPAPAAAPKAEEAGESEAVKGALDAAVAKATGLSGDRLAMLRAAVEAAGRRTDDVRLVRVFGPEEPVSGATAIGGHQYLVDFFPPSMKQTAGGGRDDRGRRGGRGGGRGGGGRGGGKGAAATGGFSMDSLREDRKNERGRGGFGGGRRPGPGGSRRGGGPSGGPGGDKK
jgi:translation initiation factor IF-2